MKNILILLLVTILIGHVTRVKDGDSFLMRSKGVIYEIRLCSRIQPSGRQSGKKSPAKANSQQDRKSRNNQHRHLRSSYRQSSRRQKYINLELVKTGNAHWYKRYAPKDKALAAAEKSAKKTKSGIWSSSTKPKPPEKYRHAPQLK